MAAPVVAPVVTPAADAPVAEAATAAAAAAAAATSVAATEAGGTAVPVHAPHSDAAYATRHVTLSLDSPRSNGAATGKRVGHPDLAATGAHGGAAHPATGADAISAPLAATGESLLVASPAAAPSSAAVLRRRAEALRRELEQAEAEVTAQEQQQVQQYERANALLASELATERKRVSELNDRVASLEKALQNEQRIVRELMQKLNSAPPPRPKIASPSAHTPNGSEVSEASPLQDVISRIEAGAFNGETLCRNVRLGHFVIACTELRVLNLRSVSWSVVWQVAWEQTKGIEMQPARARVVLQLFGRAPVMVDCGHAAVTRLVYDTLQEARQMHTERVAAASLQAGAAVGPTPA